MPQCARIAVLSALAVVGALVGPCFAGDDKPAAPVDFLLSNGLHVHLRPQPLARSVALCVLFGVGEQHDYPEPCGTAHLVEHVYVTAAAGSAPARTVEDLQRRYPIGWNAQTGALSTFVAFGFSPDRLGEEIEDAAARMRDLRPTEADLAREKPRIKLELQSMYESNVGLAAVNRARAYAASWASGCRWHGGIGPDLSLAAVKARWARFYRPANARLAIAGRFDPVATRAAIEKAFHDVPEGEAPTGVGGPPGTPPTGEPPRFETVAVAASDPTEGARLGIVAGEVSATELRRLAALLTLLSRLMPRLSELGPMQFPPPLSYAPLDGMDDVVLCVPLDPGETAASAAARVERLVDGAAEDPPSEADVFGVTASFGALFGLVPPEALATNPYLAALSAARLAEWKLSPTALRAALKAVTHDDLRSILGVGRDRFGGVVVSPKKR